MKKLSEIHQNGAPVPCRNSHFHQRALRNPCQPSHFTPCVPYTLPALSHFTRALPTPCRHSRSTPSVAARWNWSFALLTGRWPSSGGPHSSAGSAPRRLVLFRRFGGAGKPIRKLRRSELKTFRIKDVRNERRSEMKTLGIKDVRNQRRSE